MKKLNKNLNLNNRYGYYNYKNRIGWVKFPANVLDWKNVFKMIKDKIDNEDASQKKIENDRRR